MSNKIYSIDHLNTFGFDDDSIKVAKYFNRIFIYLYLVNNEEINIIYKKYKKIEKYCDNFSLRYIDNSAKFIEALFDMINLQHLPLFEVLAKTSI